MVKYPVRSKQQLERPAELGNDDSKETLDNRSQATQPSQKTCRFLVMELPYQSNSFTLKATIGESLAWKCSGAQ